MEEGFAEEEREQSSPARTHVRWLLGSAEPLCTDRSQGSTQKEMHTQLALSLEKLEGDIQEGLLM